MNLSMSDLRELLSGPSCEKTVDCGPWEVGKNYFLRTVTYHFTGKLVAVHHHELVFDDAAWIADDGRFADAMKTGSFSEVEPYPGQIIVGRGTVIDAMQITFPLPRSQK